MNIQALSNLTKECVELGFQLPRSGQFSESKSVFRLVKRKNLMTSIYKDIFGTVSFEEFFDGIQEAVHKNQYMGVEFNDVQIYVANSQKGFRFLDKSKWFLKFVIESETDLYKISVPLHKNNMELYLHGVLPLAEPSRFLDWCEYGFVSESKVTPKENRVHLKFAYSYRNSESDLTPQEYFTLTRLEDAMLQVFSMFNNRRFKESKQDTEKMDLLRNWCKIQVEQQAKNEIDVDAPIEKNEISEAWQSFDTFSSWAIQNGYEKEFLLIRKDENLPYSKENCIWNGEQEAEIVERYYWNPTDKTYHLASKFLNTMVDVSGEIKSIKEWEDSTGIPHYVLIGRYFSGHKCEEFLNPIEKKTITYLHQDITINGITRTTKEWAELVGITPNTIVSRIRYGWYGESLIAPPRKKEV